LVKHIGEAFFDAGAVKLRSRARSQSQENAPSLYALIYRSDIPAFSRRTCPSTLSALADLRQDGLLLSLYVVDPDAKAIGLVHDAVFHTSPSLDELAAQKCGNWCDDGHCLQEDACRHPMLAIYIRWPTSQSHAIEEAPKTSASIVATVAAVTKKGTTLTRHPLRFTVFGRSVYSRFVGGTLTGINGVPHILVLVALQQPLSHRPPSHACRPHNRMPAGQLSGSLIRLGVRCPYLQ
jgi:hypothetical protein